jgi:hypothetical protein
VWRGSFTIWVKAANAADAADLIEGQLEARDSDEDELVPDGARPLGGGRRTNSVWFSPNSAAKSTPWSPLVVCLLAGGIAYWGGHSLVTALRQPRDKGHRSDLYQALEALDRPLESSPAEDRSRVVLRSDPERSSIWLEEDTDGDGRADTRLQFRDGRLVGSERR